MPNNHTHTGDTMKQADAILNLDGTVTQDEYYWYTPAASETDDNDSADANVDAQPFDASVADNVIVSANQLSKLADIKGKKGVFLTPEDAVEALVNANKLPLDTLDVIAINFADFNDGRGYSYAALLRRAGYKGELRAVGDVFKDTIFYMKRCGFDTFVIKEGVSEKDAQGGLSTFTQGYQASVRDEASNYQVGA